MSEALGLRAVDPGHSLGTATPESRTNGARQGRALDQQSTVPGWPRLLSIELAAVYIGLNVELLREYVRSGRLSPVRPPRPDTARAHGFRGGTSRRTVAHDTVRRLLFDRADLDAMVNAWKAENGEAAAHG